jgi:TPR repeat protein
MKPAARAAFLAEEARYAAANAATGTAAAAFAFASSVAPVPVIAAALAPIAPWWRRPQPLGALAAAIFAICFALAGPAIAEYVIIAAGRCPLGDIAAQEAAMSRWRPLSPAARISAAERGDLGAQAYLAMMHSIPNVDSQTAVPWLQRAAARNFALAQTLLASMMVQNVGGLSSDPLESCRLFELAAAQGNVGAQYQIGVCFRDGVGRKRDYAAAARWFLQASEQGDAPSRAALAVAYLFGRGVDHDADASYRFATLAAQQGDPEGENVLGLLLTLSLTPLDPDNDASVRLAVANFERAAAKGIESAFDALHALAGMGSFEASSALDRLGMAHTQVSAPVTAASDAVVPLGAARLVGESLRAGLSDEKAVWELEAQDARL